MLTNREKEMLQLIADGNTNKEIGAKLQIPLQTVKNRVSSMMNKLDANDRAHAVAIALRKGYIK